MSITYMCAEGWTCSCNLMKETYNCNASGAEVPRELGRQTNLHVTNVVSWVVQITADLSSCESQTAYTHRVMPSNLWREADLVLTAVTWSQPNAQQYFKHPSDQSGDVTKRTRYAGNHTAHDDTPPVAQPKHFQTLKQ